MSLLAVVRVRRDFSGGAVGDRAGLAHEDVPGGWAAAVLLERTLDLERGGGRAHDEVLRQGPAEFGRIRDQRPRTRSR